MGARKFRIDAHVHCADKDAAQPGPVGIGLGFCTLYPEGATMLLTLYFAPFAREQKLIEVALPRAAVRTLRDHCDHWLAAHAR